MEKGTVIYVGAFEMPDKNAAAHRVSSVGKIFGVLGFHTVFLGRAPGRESFSGVRKSDFSDDVYEISEPASTKEWVKYMFDTSAVEDVCRRYNDVRMIIMYDMPYFSFLAVKKSFSKMSAVPLKRFMPAEPCRWHSSHPEAFLMMIFQRTFTQSQVTLLSQP